PPKLHCESTDPTPPPNPSLEDPPASPPDARPPELGQPPPVQLPSPPNKPAHRSSMKQFAHQQFSLAPATMVLLKIPAAIRPSQPLSRALLVSDRPTAPE